MPKITIYQKPTCSTCRQALQLIRERGAEYVAVNYYETPFTKTQLTELLKRAGLKPRDLLRTKEDIYKKLKLADRTHTHQSSVSTVVSRLVQRRLVQRVRAAEDARRVELTLSARGRAIAGKAPDAAQERLIAAIEALPASRRRVLAEALSELARGVAATHRRAPMFGEARAAGRQAS